MISEQLLEIREYAGTGYQPLIDYGAWRVAILRFIDELLPERLDNWQRHHETDEVFVLLQGRCILFLGAGDQTVTHVYAQDLMPLKLYNVKRGVWHTHALSQDAVVLIVENLDTTIENSPRLPLTAAHRQQVAALAQELWSEKNQ